MPGLILNVDDCQDLNHVKNIHSFIKQSSFYTAKEDSCEVQQGVNKFTKSNGDYCPVLPKVDYSISENGRVLLYGSCPDDVQPLLKNVVSSGAFTVSESCKDELPETGLELHGVKQTCVEPICDEQPDECVPETNISVIDKNEEQVFNQDESQEKSSPVNPSTELCCPTWRRSYTSDPAPEERIISPQDELFSEIMHSPAANSQPVENSHSSTESAVHGKGCEKKTVDGNDSTRNRKEGTRPQQQQKGQNQQQQSASGGDSCDLSMPSSGGAGDGRRGDDGERDDDGAGKKSESTDVEQKEDDEEEEEEKEEDDTMAGTEEQTNQTASGGVSCELSMPRRGDDGQRDGGDEKKCKTTNVEQKEDDKEDEMREQLEVMQICGMDENKDETKESKEREHRREQQINNVTLDIPQSLRAVLQECSRSGDYYLRHLRECNLGHAACEECHQYLDGFGILITSTPEKDGRLIFPFLGEYTRSNTQEEKYLIILKWLYDMQPRTLKAQECYKALKRVRLSSSQGARPRKRLKRPSVSNEPMETTPSARGSPEGASNEPMQTTPSPWGSPDGASTEPMETTPSPGESPEGASVFPGPSVRRQGVVHGSPEDLRRVMMSWDNDTTDGEINNGVIFNPRLNPCGGCYRIDREFRQFLYLGRGTFGEAHVAVDEESDQEFVYKVVDFENFEPNEVLIWMQLHHPRIVPLWGVVRHGNRVYMMSEYIPSRPLAARLNDNGSKNDQYIVEWIRQILEVLQYIHSKNIVNMDIKPENCLIANNGNGIHIIDWGLSLQLNDNGVLLIGEPRGTEFYMAPEVVRGEAFNATVDIWSALCTAIFLLSGSPPWVSRFPDLKTYQLVIGTRPPPIEDIPSTIHAAIIAFLTEAFRTRPTASQLLEHPIFCMDDFPREPTRCFYLEEEPAEEEEVERFPCPPPDGLSPTVAEVTAAYFRPLGEDDTSPADAGCGDISQAVQPSSDSVLPIEEDPGNSNMSQNLPQEAPAVSPECRLQEYAVLFSSFTTLQPPWCESRPESQPTGAPVQDGLPYSPECCLNDHPADLYSSFATLQPSGHESRNSQSPPGQLNTPTSQEDLTNLLGNLSLTDGEDIYGPGPPDQQPDELRSFNTQGSAYGQYAPLAQNPTNQQGFPLAQRSKNRSESTDIPMTPDRRSSSQSSVFDLQFPCLDSTSGTDTSEDNVARPADRQRSTFAHRPADGQGSPSVQIPPPRRPTSFVRSSCGFFYSPNGQGSPVAQNAVDSQHSSFTRSPSYRHGLPPERATGRLTSTDVPATPDRSSSSEPRTFEEHFPCLGTPESDQPSFLSCLASTPDTDTSDYRSASACTPPEPAHRNLARRFSTRKEVIDKLEQLHSESNLECMPSIGLRMAEIGSSGYFTSGSAEAPEVPRTRTRKQSQSQTVSIRVFGEQIFAQCGTTYGKLAEDISTKIYSMCELKGMNIECFKLQDQYGNLFGENDKVKPACEIHIVEAEEDGVWRWCVTPYNRLEYNTEEN